ncbi:unnamed protein product [Allacma fusca]|uniref:Uncharacterized protein n=1 Tax=Allacma fusca TaxID=39272 RepID=A0A8J2LAJ5_9HEXA|nr:unnamed protein product [Allacma fusca]
MAGKGKWSSGEYEPRMQGAVGTFGRFGLKICMKLNGEDAVLKRLFTLLIQFQGEKGSHNICPQPFPTKIQVEGEICQICFMFSKGLARNRNVAGKAKCWKNPPFFNKICSRGNI